MGDATPMDLTSSALVPDLYQLTILQAYFDEGMEETAVFEFFVRKLPPGRGFLMAAGLEQALDYLEHLRLTPRELDWLVRSGRFGRDFVDYLECLGARTRPHSRQRQPRRSGGTHAGVLRGTHR